MRTELARAGRLVALAAATIIVVAACGGGATPSPAAPSAAPATPSAETPAPAPDEYGVNVGESADLGSYLTGKDGLTLYLFTKDSGSTSSCYEECATAWPPFLIEDGEQVTAGAGVGGTFGTTDRTDGTKQVTYGGVPLYYFAGDAKAGDTNGEGLNDVWFVVAP